MDAVKACTLDPLLFAQAFDTAARRRGFRTEPIGNVAGVPLAAYTRRTPGPRPRIYLSSGTHGDEPAAPLALLDMLERDWFDERANWFLCPLLNPTGFVRGTRENAEAIDLNRDYRQPRTAEVSAHVHWLQRQPSFDLTFCLHEDFEARGFYLYELNPAARPSLAAAMITAVRHDGPIEEAAIIDGRPASAPGIIRPDIDPLLRDQWPEALYLREHHCTLSYTLETPSGFDGALRIAMHRTAINAALNTYILS